MFLVVWQPSPDSGIDDDRETLRVVTKMLFAQVQAVLPPNTRLIQAGLLISIFEYAHELGDAAFVSIGSCANMASITGLNAHTSGEAGNETEEERNLCWGVVIYERAIACNCSTFSQPFLTEIPSIEDDLPSESEFLDRTPGTVYSEHRLANWNKESVGSFGRSALATFLFSRTIESMKIAGLEDRHKLSSAIDVHLQQLLSTVLDQGKGMWGPYCGAAAIIINTLCILHQCVLDQASSDCTAGVPKESSSVAVDSLTRMVIDIAYSFNQTLPVIDTEVSPPICVYLVRSAMHNFHRINSPGDETRNPDFEELSKMLQYGAISSIGGVTRKYTRHPKQHETAPRRPLSAYVVFSNTLRKELKARSLSFAEITKLVGENWQKISRPLRRLIISDKLLQPSKDIKMNLPNRGRQTVTKSICST